MAGERINTSDEWDVERNELRCKDRRMEKLSD
jgi:hypothetical protein